MWIKLPDGDYVNTDKVSNIYLDDDGDTVVCFGDVSQDFWLEGDHRDDIITNIISGTKVMEVQ